MAVVIIADWIEPETERSTVNYDVVSEQLAQGEPIDGLIVHSAGYAGSGFRILEIWESRAHYDRFISDRLMPLLVAQEGDPTPPTLTEYELHNLLVP